MNIVLLKEDGHKGHSLEEVCASDDTDESTIQALLALGVSMSSVSAALWKKKQMKHWSVNLDLQSNNKAWTF